MSRSVEDVLSHPENSKTSRGMSRRGVYLLGAAGAVFVGVYVATGPFLAPAFRRICLPFVPATPEQVRNVFSLLAQRRKSLPFKQGKTTQETLLDIGSGDGRIVIEAAKQGYRATGVELNMWLVWWSRIAAWRAGVSSNTKFVRKNLWNFNMKPYNNIVIFGVEEMMAPLQKKIDRESDRGTIIVACRNQFLGWEPELETGEGVEATWIYSKT